jgi:hypothetical protein
MARYVKTGPFNLNVAPPFDSTTFLDGVETGILTAQTAFCDINTQSGTTYTPVATDAGQRVELTVAATVTIPANVFARGQFLLVAQNGAGTVSLVAGAGLTMRPSSPQITGGQWKSLMVTFLSTTECVVE